MARKFIAVISGGVTEIHAPDDAGNYGTMCGISIDDDEDIGREAPLPAKPKISCRTCIQIITAGKQYRKSDLQRAK